ncbi:MAG TPA: efflux RND transporter periplasmic adaptor subunit [Vicinamibacterales bacterium]|jgi:HlyD family secretion protein|nr:efflux RND transporter periplasmic adaptor subunit [Vicinamibacterales bacterium]
MKKLIWIVILLVVVGAGGAVFYANRGDKEPTVSTLKVSRGDIVDAVGATGTLQAVTTVTVGTQVSGIVQDLYADFNSIVKKNAVIARLDPALLETAVETAKANLVNAQANLERQKVTLADANAKLARAKELNDRQLLTKADYETADATAKQAEAQLKSTESQIVQAEAAVNKAKVDLDHTIITAPIDGIVISRNVDKGQTVASSMQAPTLFVIAADLTKMQVNANIDESDVGRMRPGQDVTFRVDAYPTETFHGSVKQVRLNPQTVQNVVTYSTVIDVPNPDYKLKPGMTANVNIEIARRTNVLRVPNAALRFRPTKDIFDALKQPMPPELERGFGRGNRNGQQNARGDQGAPSGAPVTNLPGAAPQPPGTATPGQATAKIQANQQKSAAGQAASQQGGGRGEGGGGRFANMTPEERQKRMQERLASMTPEQRAQWEQRMKDRQAEGGGRSGFGGGQGNVGGGRGGNTAARQQNAQTGGAPAPRAPRADKAGGQASSKLMTSSAETIDSLFGPLPTIETRGRAWLYINKQLKPVNLRLGISDGTYTEVLNDTELQDGIEVVTNVVTPEMASKPASQQNNANNPLMPQRGRGPGGPGGGGGRGR